MKVPALRIALWTAVKKCWNWCCNCCCKIIGQDDPPQVEAPPGAASAPEEELGALPPPIPPLRETRPFLSQPESGYGQSFYRGRGAEGAGVSFCNTGGPRVNLPQHLQQQELQNPDLMASKVISDSLKRLNEKILASGESLARLGKKIEK